MDMILLWIILIVFSVIVIVAVLQISHDNKNKKISGGNNQFSTRPGYVKIDIANFTEEYNSAIPQDKFIMLQKMILQGCIYAEIPKSEYDAIIASKKMIK